MSTSGSSDEDDSLLTVKFDKTRKRDAMLTSRSKGSKRARLASSSESSDSALNKEKKHEISKTSKTNSTLEDNSGKEEDEVKLSNKAVLRKEKKFAKSKVQSLEVCKTSEENGVKSEATLVEDKSETDDCEKIGDKEATSEKSDTKKEAEHDEVDVKKGSSIESKTVNAEKTVSSSSDSEGTLAALRADRLKNAASLLKKKCNDSYEDDSIDPDLHKNVNDKKKVIDDRNSSDDKLRKKLSKSARPHDPTIIKKKFNEDSSRFKRLKRLAAVAGLRFRYKQMEGIKSDLKKCRILKEFMTEHGVTKFTLKDCKEFRIKKEEEAELAELKNNKIYGADSTRRVTRGSRRQEEFSRALGRKAHLSTSSSNNGSEREELIEGNRQIFGRLKGIVSDESD